MLMNDCSKNLGKILKQRRQSNRLTLRELSDASGVSPSHLGRIEKGERYPSAAILRRLAKPLRLSEGEIFTLAGYLSPLTPVNHIVEPAPPKIDLDPYVVRVLSKEPVEVQRGVVEILSMVKRLSTGQVPANYLASKKISQAR